MNNRILVRVIPTTLLLGPESSESDLVEACRLHKARAFASAWLRYPCQFPTADCLLSSRELRARPRACTPYSLPQDPKRIPRVNAGWQQPPMEEQPLSRRSPPTQRGGCGSQAP